MTLSIFLFLKIFCRSWSTWFLFFKKIKKIKKSKGWISKKIRFLTHVSGYFKMMMQSNNLPKQPWILVSHWNVGKLLYGALLLFIVETLYYYYEFMAAYDNEHLAIKLFWTWCLLFSFSHIFLVIMDMWSRFQDYKRIKDYLFQYGFNPRIISPYRGSKCQRMAVMAAARELGMQREAGRYYKKLGIKWFHFVPTFMIKDPFFPFKKYFWSRTFTEKYYQPKFNYREFQKISV